MIAESLQEQRVAMYNRNALKIGLFGANCSSGRAVTTVPERWPGDWDHNLRLARMADDAGIDFLLPIGRWKGYGGDTDYQGSTYETITWATGLLASTKRITVFGTVHAPLFPPIIASKQMVTADHVGGGRFGLNIVCGWNEGEFDMFGVSQQDHDGRYAQGQEWFDVVQKIWTEDDFDFEGKYFKMKGVRVKPKPFGGTRPVTMNAGYSPEGRAFAIRNCDALFTTANLSRDLDSVAAEVGRAKTAAREAGHDIGVFTVGVVTCRPTKKEAEEYFRYTVVENADWSAVDNILAMKGFDKLPPDERQKAREGYAQGMGGVPLVGEPDAIAEQLARVTQVGMSGIGLSFVNYADELPYFIAEVLPRLARMGLRG
jgi:alkanesulfonate monooxygenase SsuD/methylene tetrahydromethanopterin reductase-like flavin-dependent oxidoreductase (luciferase family)